MKSTLTRFLIVFSLVVAGFSANAYDFTVSGHVFFAFDGVPVPGMEVNWTSENGEITTAITNEDGYYSQTFSIPDGTVQTFIGQVWDFCDSTDMIFAITVTSAEGEVEVDFVLCSNIEFPECQAAFYYEQEEDGTVQFVDDSWPPGEVQSWTWEFGDGTESDEQNPVHTYAEEGEYLVSLTIVANDTCESTMEYYIYVGEDWGWEECSVYFYWWPEDNDDPLTISFEGEVWTEEELVSWHWNFGDGSESVESHPVHTYAEEGEYHVTVSILTADSCSSVFEMPIYVGGGCWWLDECQAYFWYEQEYSDSTNTVLFFDESWVDGSEIVSWTWDFGDGEASSEQNPIHVYTEEGEYVVTLSIETADSCSSTIEQMVWVGDNICWPEDCQAFFWYEQDYSDSTNTVHFFDESWGDVFSWEWEFGDGTTSSEPNPVHSYAEAGVYVVTLTIMGEEDCMSTFVMEVHIGESDCNCYEIYAPVCVISASGDIFTFVNDCYAICEGFNPEDFVECGDPWWDECQASFYYYQEDPASPLSVQFFDSSYGEIENWTWDFGDNSFSDEQNPVHTYAEEGEYVVTLTISGADSCSSTVEYWVAVTDCVCTQEFDPVCVMVGNGELLWFPNPCVAICEGFSEADLVECDDDPWWDACEASFYYTSTAASVLDVMFMDESWGEPNSWSWDFGDGNTSDEQNPVHTYAEEGVYIVSLTIMTADSCSSTSTWDVWIGDDDTWVEDEGCQAMFWFTQDENDPNTISFEDMSFGGEFTYWEWNFGDGNTSNEQNPVHTYAEEGIYLVTLNAEGEECNSTFVMLTMTGENVIYGEDCQALFIPFLNDLEVFFLDLSVGQGQSIYAWDFGDGTTSEEAFPFHTYDAPGVYEVTLTTVTEDGCTSTFGVTLNLEDANIQGNAILAAIISDTDEASVPVFADAASLFPNPVVDKVNVTFDLLQQNEYKLSVVTASGQVVQEKIENGQRGDNKVQLNVSSLPQGMYFVKILAGEETKTLKFVK